MQEMTADEKRRYGFNHFLFTIGKHGNTFFVPEKYELFLNQHPFGLKIPPLENIRGFNPGRPISLIGEIGSPEHSVDLMIGCLNQAISISWEKPFTHFRIILEQVKNPRHHFVYYEFGTPSHVFICGGCTDFSGGGGKYKGIMDGIFDALATIYGLGITTARIPWVLGYRQNIQDKQNAHMRQC